MSSPCILCGTNYNAEECLVLPDGTVASLCDACWYGLDPVACFKCGSHSTTSWWPITEDDSVCGFCVATAEETTVLDWLEAIREKSPNYTDPDLVRFLDARSTMLELEEKGADETTVRTALFLQYGFRDGLPSWSNES